MKIAFHSVNFSRGVCFSATWKVQLKTLTSGWGWPWEHRDHQITTQSGSCPKYWVSNSIKPPLDWITRVQVEARPWMGVISSPRKSWRCSCVALNGERLEDHTDIKSVPLRGCVDALSVDGSWATFSTVILHMITCTLAKVFYAINMKNLLCSLDFISFSLCLFLFKSANKFFLRTTWNHHLNKQPHRWPGKRTSVCIMFPAKIAAWALVWTHSIWTQSLILCSELTWSLCRCLLSDLGMIGYVSQPLESPISSSSLNSIPFAGTSFPPLIPPPNPLLKSVSYSAFLYQHLLSGLPEDQGVIIP